MTNNSEHPLKFTDWVAYMIQTSILINPFSYKSIMIQRTHHIKFYKVIQLMYSDNNFSHFCQIIFLNSIQAPKQERALFHSPAEQTPRVSLLATFAFLLFIPQTKEQNILKSKIENDHRPQFAPAQVLSYIHRGLSNLLKIGITQVPTSPSGWLFQDGGLRHCITIDFSSWIPLISPSSWRNGACTLETVKNMKNTISYISTCHHGPLIKCVRCGVHQSGLS